MEFQGQKMYHRDECAIFLKTKECFGGLSNMAGGFSLSINNIQIPTSEALYQACRFPHRSELQKIIIGQRSPMTAKMKSKPYRSDSRPDWDKVRVEIMCWCLRVKLVQHWEKFGDLLLSTDDKPIVEESRHDQFWGAKPTTLDTLVGMNILGQLLTTLREQLKGPNVEKLRVVEPPALPQFLLVNKPIGVIERKNDKYGPSIGSSPPQSTTEFIISKEDLVATRNNNTEIPQTGEMPTELALLNSSISQEKIPVQLTFDY